MAIKDTDIPTILIERVEATNPAPAYFDRGETDEWPQDALPSLLRQGVLKEADRAEAITCPGCEWQCHRRVLVRRAGDLSRARIMCDEEPRHGWIPVDLRRLQRFETDLRTLALLVATELKVGAPKISRSGAIYALGEVKGRHGKRPALVGIEAGQLVLGVGEQRELMARILAWAPSGLVLDTKHVQRLIDRKDGKTTAGREYVADRSEQKRRADETRKRHAAIFREAKQRHTRGAKWSHIADEIAGTELAPYLTGDTVRRIITELRRIERKNSRSKRQKPKCLI